MRRSIALFILSALAGATLAASVAAAQETVPGYADSIFKARVVEILDEQAATDEYAGTSAIQQNLRVRGLQGEWAGQESTSRALH